MRNLLWAIVTLLGVLFVAGFVVGEDRDRLRISTAESKNKRVLSVIIALPDVNSRYRWLSIHGCSATIEEHGTFCTGDFETESSKELDGRTSQHLFDWRDTPKGAYLLTAAAFDQDRRVIATGTRVVFR